MKLAERVNYITEPQTIAMAKLSRELIAQGHDVISLSLGEPDFFTPQHVKDAAKQAIEDNFSFYTPVAGTLELREAVVAKLKRENNLTYTPDQILISTGAKQCIMNTLMALVNKGDEVIIPTPYWVSYSDMTKLIEGVPVFINTTVEQQYKITAAQLEAVISTRSKVFLFSSPCNPTGSIYTKQELESLVAVFEKHPDIYIISDEIYEFINFIGKHESIAQFESIKDRVITINGLSKAYAMTGWRLGYLAAHPTITKACEKIQSQYTSGTSSISQKAAVAALNGTMEPSKAMIAAFKQRQGIILNAVKDMTHWKCNNPVGAFYIFPDISYYFGKSHNGTTIHTATDFCMYMLHNAHVSMVTGEAFGAPNCIRISYAIEDSKIIEAMRRVKLALEKLV
ncbi:MAG: pyridoxal phosphate-dependent aminotransferase [Bacteroidia bacterium]|nr:pyridoxal phosphate-dependent aminotransferase [Bacteroidia bacterium]